MIIIIIASIELLKLTTSAVSSQNEALIPPPPPNSVVTIDMAQSSYKKGNYLELFVVYLEYKPSCGGLSSSGSVIQCVPGALSPPP